MRVNVYAEEMTDRIEIVEKVIDGITFTGLRFYLYLPVTMHELPGMKPGDSLEGGPLHIRGQFEHRSGDDDSSAVTFWGTTSLRDWLLKALAVVDEHDSGKLSLTPR